MLAAAEGEVVTIRVPWPDTLRVIEDHASSLINHVCNELPEGLTLADDCITAYVDTKDSTIVRTYRVIRTPE